MKAKRTQIPCKGSSRAHNLVPIWNSYVHPEYGTTVLSTILTAARFHGVTLHLENTHDLPFSHYSVDEKQVGDFCWHQEASSKGIQSTSEKWFDHGTDALLPILSLTTTAVVGRGVAVDA